MTEWLVTLDFKWTLYEAEVDTLIAELATHHPVVEARKDWTSVTLSVEAADATSALMEAVDLVSPCTGALGRATIEGLKVQTAEALDRELERPQIPDLGGVTDFADMLGVTRQRAWDITQREDFPEPVLETKVGPLWLLSQLQTWNSTHERKPGRPRSDMPNSPQEVALRRMAMKRQRVS